MRRRNPPATAARGRAGKTCRDDPDGWRRRGETGGIRGERGGRETRPATPGGWEPGTPIHRPGAAARRGIRQHDRRGWADGDRGRAPLRRTLPRLPPALPDATHRPPAAPSPAAELPPVLIIAGRGQLTIASRDKDALDQLESLLQVIGRTAASERVHRQLLAVSAEKRGFPQSC